MSEKLKPLVDSLMEIAKRDGDIDVWFIDMSDGICNKTLRLRDIEIENDTMLKQPIVYINLEEG